jgi:hypothetical protein
MAEHDNGGGQGFLDVLWIVYRSGGMPALGAYLRALDVARGVKV